ncbi:phosphatase PAP2 family protein [Niastella caeni]|uniref:Phosphatase PAP2 family protein n=1 Tax=Niastella caeni TaxID=2569763 RepID=A0A4V4H1A7_9BACT|nr:phosphatase PAP2 family protein [Niastella caeni]
MLLSAVCFCYFKPCSAQKLNFDQRILVNMMESRTEGTTKVMRGISDYTQEISFLIPATVTVVGLIDNNKMTLKKGLYLAESAAAATFITYGMKYSFKRSRPYMKINGLSAAGTGNSPSFPSGHTSVAFASATSLYLAYPKWYVAVPAFTYAAAVGYSRMYLGVHYPSDVLAGAVIGAGSAWLMYKANKWLFKKKPNTATSF